MRFFYNFFLIFSFCLISVAHASEVMVKEFWGKAPIGQMPMAAAYGVIKNDTDKDVYIVSVSTPEAKSAEIHTHVHDEHGVVRMRPLSELRVPAKGEAVLKPGGDHFMIFDVSSDWAAGKKASLFLETKAGEFLTASVQIVSASDFSPYKQEEGAK